MSRLSYYTSTTITVATELANIYIVVVSGVNDYLLTSEAGAPSPLRSSGLHRQRRKSRRGHGTRSEARSPQSSVDSFIGGFS
eukprot:COSAG06_NODE_19754_length_823_cov_1.718232_1_plen_82_part_00